MKNSELLSALKALVAREREVLVELLRHLREVEARELHLAQGYSSLFAFCTGELGYSEPEAQVRIQAMRLMKGVPRIEAQLEDGSLSLSVAAKVQGACRRNKVENPSEILRAVDGLSARATDRKLAELFPEEKKREKARPLDGENTRIEFTASKQLMEKLIRLKELMAHKNYDGRFDLLFEEMADLALEKLEPAAEPEKLEPAAEPRRLVKTGVQPKNDAPILRTSTNRQDCRFGLTGPKGRERLERRGQKPELKVRNSRYIPRATRRSLPWEAGCAFPGCGSRHGLQIDHIIPYSQGGTNAPENLQLLCGAHNRHKGTARNNHGQIKSSRALPPASTVATPSLDTADRAPRSPPPRTQTPPPHRR